MAPLPRERRRTVSWPDDTRYGPGRPGRAQVVRLFKRIVHTTRAILFGLTRLAERGFDSVSAAAIALGALISRAA